MLRWSAQCRIKVFVYRRMADALAARLIRSDSSLPFGHFLSTGLEDAGTSKECVQQVFRSLSAFTFSGFPWSAERPACSVAGVPFTQGCAG